MKKEKLTELVRQAQSGDGQAMEELLKAAHTHVSYQCRQIMKNTEDAEDMTQEVLIKIYNSLDSLAEPEKFLSWANSIAARHCINELRRNPKDLQFTEDEDGNSLMDELAEQDEQKIPDSAIDNAETTRMIADMINELPDAQRMCTYLFYYDQMSVNEIAEMIGVSGNTVKSRLNYARKALKESVLVCEKQGVKLYGMSPLPFLTYILHSAAESGADSAAASSMAKIALGAAGTSAAAGGAAGTSAATGAAAAKGAGFFGTVAGKAAAAVAAGVIVVGGVVAVVSNKPEEAPPETPAPIVETVEPEAPAFPACTAKQTVFEAENIYYYWETPVFDSDSEGYKAINRHYDDCIGDFADFFNGAIQGGCTILDRNLIEYNGGTTHIASRTDFKVLAQDGRYVTIVSYSYDDCPYEGLEIVPVTYKTFDVETGRRVNLGDILDGTNEEIAAMIDSKLEQEDGGGEADEGQAEHNLWNYDFYIENGQVWCLRKAKSTEDSPTPVLIAELAE